MSAPDSEPRGAGAGDGWDLPDPFVAHHVVEPDEIDAYRHVNNAVYVTWLDRAAWAHSAALGLPIERCLDMDRGMAVLRSTFVYLKPALLGEPVEIGTWLVPTDARLRARRRFQVRGAGDGATLLRAEIEYVCIELSSGRPVRSPAAFRERYLPNAATEARMAMLPPL